MTPSLLLVVVALAAAPNPPSHQGRKAKKGSSARARAQRLIVPELPPPPPGMRVLQEDDKELMLSPAHDAAAAPGASVEGVEAEARTPAPGDAGEPEATDAQVEKESAELEELAALEKAALDPGAAPSAEVLQSLRRLGFANPLRDRMLDVLEEPALRDDAPPPDLPRITDLAAFDIASVRERYDIPVEMQPLVAQYIQFFQGPGRKWFRKWMARSARYMPLMQPILEKHGLPRDTVYLAMIESGFSPNALSWAKAAGPWQFMPPTGKQYGLKQDFWVDERRDPVKATEAAAKYLRDLHKELGHWYLAWAGYNTGSYRVRKMVERYETRNFWDFIEEKGLPLETKHYVPKLIACGLGAKHPKAFGFSDAELSYEDAFTFDTVELTEAADLDVVARASGTSVADIQELNPELRRWATPPASRARPYLLRVPAGRSEQFAQAFAKLAPHERLTYKVHQVKRGDTLSAIALKYGSAPEAILQMNRLANARRLKLGSDLLIPVPTGRAAGKGEAVLARKVAQARRSGVVAARPEEEVPAGARAAPVPAGPVKTETVNGRTRVTYGVTEGDNLWSIAQRFGVTVDQLKDWNDLGGGRRGARALKVGTVLHVWPSTRTPAVQERQGTLVAAKAPPPPVSGRHQLAAGETLWDLSRKYGVSVDELKRWNGIRDTRSLRAGQQLRVARP